MNNMLDNNYTKRFLYFFIGILAIVLTSYLLTNQLLHCHDICSINWDAIKFYPYTDFAENLTGAMNAANGYKFGIDFQQPHSPGIYLLLGIFYKLIGLASIEPSIGSAYLRLVFGSVFLLAMVSYFFYKEFGLKLGLLVLCSLLVIFYPLKFYLPMSETFAFWLSIPLIHSNLVLLNGQKTFITFEDLALPVLITFFGVGFPSVLVLPYLIYFGFLFGKKDCLKKVDIFKYFAFLAGLVSIVLLMTNPDSLWFWVVEINRGDVRQHLLENIWANITSIDEWYSFYALLSYIPLFFLFVIWTFTEKKINFKSLLYILVIYLPIFWRVPDGYKAIVSVSVLISLFLFVYSKYFYKEKFVKLSITLFLVVGIFSSNLTNLVSGLDISGFSKVQEFSSMNFNICKFSGDSPSNCRCVNSLVFGPQVYLQNNIKQCQYQMNTWGSRLGTSSKYMKIAYDSVADHYASYIVPPIQFYKDDLPLTDFIQHIEKEYECKIYNNDWRFCSYR